MSLHLEKIEESLESLITCFKSNRWPLFYYPTAFFHAKKEIDQLRSKLESNLYGPKTKERIQGILNRWESELVMNIQIPADTELKDVTALVMWTIGACSFQVIDERHPGDDVREYQVQFQNSIHILRILRMHGYGFVVYLDSYEIKYNNPNIRS